MGETRVDLQHLLEDLRDAYTGALEETILTEMIANALDSGATRVSLVTNPVDATLTIIDDGRGMRRRELARYHDVAASTKTPGEAIGFAGVGIKLGLLVSREVVTETRRGASQMATTWRLSSRHRAPWKWIQPPGLTTSRGTAVRLVLTNQLSPLLDAGYIEETIRRHFEPLLDSAFDDVLRRHYPEGMGFEVDGRELARLQHRTGERVPVSIRLGRRRTPSAVGFIERTTGLQAEQEGVAISTFGKIIKRGWDWLGLAPAARAHVSGVIEAPDLATSLTLSKNDFIRTGTRGALYLAYRKSIQEVVSNQLARWGDSPDVPARPRTVRLERDLERVLEDLADDFPLLRSLVDRHRGGQKRLPMPGRGDERVPASLFANVSASTINSADRTLGPSQPSEGGAAPASPRPSPTAVPRSEREPVQGVTPPAAEPGADNVTEVAVAATLETIRGRRSAARYGLLVQFESRPDDDELGRLVDNTVWINDAHPAFSRAATSRSLGYHTALVVALALAPLAVEARDEHRFITRFLAHWGGASTATQQSRPRRRRA